jgi:NAD-dependent dihydropyrimidine dehydrogenase PreA subunit
MTYVINDACIDVMEKKCVRECPVDCIYLGERSAYIQSDECIDCGACAVVCPVKAISYEGDLKPEERDLLTRQREVFSVVGAPGGARAFGAVLADHPTIAMMPRKSKAGD